MEGPPEGSWVKSPTLRVGKQEDRRESVELDRKSGTTLGQGCLERTEGVGVSVGGRTVGVPSGRVGERRRGHDIRTTSTSPKGD